MRKLVIAWLLLLSALTAQAATEKTLWQPYYVFPRAAASQQHLNLSADWELTWLDRQVNAPADLAVAATKWRTVAAPTSVQMALHKAGELPHPYFHLNSSKYSWVDEKVWYYRKSFEAPRTASRYAFLYFHGIDYFARVWLNGKLLGSHEGMFAGPALEVSQDLAWGASNEIVVEVRAGNWGQKATYKPREPGRIIKPWVIAGGTGGEMFFPLGMWQGVRLEFAPAMHLERPFVVTRTADGQQARLHLSVEVLNGVHSLEQQLHATGNTQMRHYNDWWKVIPKARKLTVEFELREKTAAGRAAFSKAIPVNAMPGRNWVEEDLTIPTPKLWWPNGMGEANLYRARVVLKDGAETLDQIEFDYGIRTLGVEMTPGPRVMDRWSPWQFTVNGRKFFAKGINWMPADILLDLPKDRYHWLLSAARNAGVQFVRIWGGGILEPEEFYEVANELGILVWQDFPIGNMITPEYPQPVWEAQVMQTIFRLRNHPSLALWCGGNEFNPYAEGNAASIGILERSLADFDPTRPFRRTSPDNGSMHDYPDMDPTWYSRKFPFLPYMAETGMHNIPNAKTMREVVSAEELSKPLSRMYEEEFATRFPDFRHHFVEYIPARVPRMLSRASHVADIREPSLEDIAEATQIGAAEFYQVMSEALQANYPVTAGLMPWVFKRPWPVVAIQTLDGFGHPTAPYYFLKRTYAPTHLAWTAEHLLWAPGETVGFEVALTHSLPRTMAGLVATVQVLSDEGFAPLWSAKQSLSVKAGPAVSKASMGRWKIPADYRDRYFFVLVELRTAAGRLESRQVYWPRSLSILSDAKTLGEFRDAPKEWPSLDRGPWLKPVVGAVRSGLRVECLGRAGTVYGRERLQVRVTNNSGKPAFPVSIEIEGVRHSAFASDNLFWLAPGESRTVSLEVMWREAVPGSGVRIAASAWNAERQEVALPERR